MKISPELLKKYATKQCSEQEKLFIEQWLETENQTQDEEEVYTSVFLEEKIWGNIQKEIILEPQRSKNSFQNKIIYVIAASITLIIGITIFKKPVAIPEKFLICQTLAGEMKNITLSDGTLVHLNSNSILKIPEKFTGDKRMVSFVGEAYFEVTKDILHPFIIQTKKSETTVLGTKFNLSAYAEESTTLTLDEGKVSFKDKNNIKKPLIILPNEQAVLNDEGVTKSIVNTKYYKGWLNNIIYFNNESFLSISQKIERVYDVEIQIKNTQLKNQIYKGEFDNPSLENLLDDLSFVLKFKYEIKGNKINIY